MLLKKQFQESKPTNKCFSSDCLERIMASTDSLENTMKVIDAFTQERDWEQFHSVKNLMASVSIEASELNETIQWENPTPMQVKENSKLLTSIGDELADVIVYCLRLCSVLGLEPIELMNNKIEKNRIKYPVDKSKGSSKKYTNL